MDSATTNNAGATTSSSDAKNNVEKQPLLQEVPPPPAEEVEKKTPPAASAEQQGTGGSGELPVLLQKDNVIIRDKSVLKRLAESGSVKRIVSEKAIEEVQEIQDANKAHAISVELVCKLLETDPKNGISEEEAKIRLQKYGKNKISETPPTPIYVRAWRQINNALIWVLLIAAAISGGVGEWAEFGLILGVVVVNVIIGLLQEGKAEAAARSLKSMLSQKANVIRGGVRNEVPGEDVVIGDLVFFESGNKIPADCRIVSLQNLSIQESMLTGESKAVSKTMDVVEENAPLGDRKCIAFSATSCVKGQGFGIVVATADSTEIGKINRLVSEVKQTRTNLQIQIDVFGHWIAFMVVPLAILSFCLAYFLQSSHDWKVAFIEAIAIAVAVIPEGLPAVLTITLALAMQNMAAKNAVVKALPSVETLGSVMVICSDKTGTLTKNEMTVVNVRTGKYLYSVSGVGYDPVGGEVKPTLGGGEEEKIEKDFTLNKLYMACALCNDGRLERQEVTQGKTVSQRVVPIGDPSEVCLITLIEKEKMDVKQVRTENPRLGVIPFESEYKFMGTIHAVPGGDGVGPEDAVMYLKGAPDRLIAKAKFQYRKGTLEAIPIDREFWQKQVVELSSKGFRCLAMCLIPIKNKTQVVKAVGEVGADFIVAKTPEELGMIFIGLTAIMDPPRQECVQSIKEAHEAGIEVKMITGDHPATAKAIGEQLNLVDAKHPLVKTGPELDEMTEEEIKALVLKCNVYARASPANKIQIIRGLQQNQKVCSMTGDGVNDAPALAAADIGVAMGITGTDVSRDAAKIILADDNFSTIVEAVKEGRRVWDNLRKILIFNQPVNFAQGMSLFIALCLQWKNAPLTAIQVLYVNMITSITLGMMLAMEPSEDGIMTRPPRRTNKPLIGKLFLWRCFSITTMLVCFVLGSFAWFGALGYGLSQQRGLALNVLVFSEIAYAWNCRFLKRTAFRKGIFFGNVWCYVSSFIMCILQVFILYTPGVDSFFSQQGGIDGKGWGITILFMVLTFLIVEFEKALVDPLFVPYVKPCLTRLFCNSAFVETTKPLVPIALKNKSGASLIVDKSLLPSSETSNNNNNDNSKV